MFQIRSDVTISLIGEEDYPVFSSCLSSKLCFEAVGENVRLVMFSYLDASD